MDLRALAANLATSLANSAWTKADVTRTLEGRLPKALGLDRAALATDLLDAHPQLYSPPHEAIKQTLLRHRYLPKIQRYSRSRKAWPTPDLRAPKMRPLPVFANLALPALESLVGLAGWLAISPDRLGWYADLQNRANMHEEMAVNHYHWHVSPKRAGGHRLIEAPKARLKAMQRRILTGILDQVPPHDDAFGFVKGRSCQQGAQRHAGEELVICFDIKDFFTSVPSGRVFALFRCLGYPENVARNLTGLCTLATPARILDRVPDLDRTKLSLPHLPQGAPTSPALANLTCFSLDRRLAGLARRAGASYSRYADDLTFSGARAIHDIILKSVPDILTDEGFALNPAKTRAQSCQHRQMVTGIVVNQHLNLPRPVFDRIKAILHACKSDADNRLSDPVFRARLEGQITWVENLNPARGYKLRRLYNQCLMLRQRLAS